MRTGRLEQCLYDRLGTSSHMGETASRRAGETELDSDGPLDLEQVIP